MIKNFFSLFALLLLTACQTSTGGPDVGLWGNLNFMPAGYTYHRDEYKAPPGPRVTPPVEEAGDTDGQMTGYDYNLND